MACLIVVLWKNETFLFQEKIVRQQNENLTEHQDQLEIEI